MSHHGNSPFEDMAEFKREMLEAARKEFQDSQGQSTANSETYQHFLKCLRLWEAMLPRRASDEVSGELLARGYWRMLGSKLSQAQMSVLSEMVLDRCKWFPTVAECNEIMAVQSYSNPFYRERNAARLTANGYPEISPPMKAISDASG